MSQHAASRSTAVARPFSARLGNILLWIASAGGVVCIILVILSGLFNISLIMFKTGSMSPTIPTGSLALVREIPASEVQLGDVVTVDRAGELPVTHRVVELSGTGVADSSGNGASRLLTLRGDANPVNDPAPYDVSHVRIVLASVPHLATVIIAVSHPFVLGGITVAAGLLVTWAFWPRGSAVAAPRRSAVLSPSFGRPAT
jgi:signal peptidase